MADARFKGLFGGTGPWETDDLLGDNQTNPTGGHYTDGKDYQLGVNNGLPSEFWLDRMVYTRRASANDASRADDFSNWIIKISVRNATGAKPGPPDRTE